jgi:radical SAM superfamily enzyme YgiQ (UPF0313 family)
MPEIVLTTLNARYIHAAFGLRYLMANLADLKPRAALTEFDIHQRPADIAEALLELSPRILGLGVYIWNVGPATELVSLLKRIRPDLIIILGGPEVSHDWQDRAIVDQADYLITGEGDLEFRRLCLQLLAGERPARKVIPAASPALTDLVLPYELYSEEDISHRVLYVEASRGCPFQCEFCLSSMEVAVRQADLDRFLEAMRSLIARGARHLKFVDRTFNLNLNVSRRILEFCRDQYQEGMLFHFELIPDRLPTALRDIIQQFPPAALQFEVGIQTFNEDVAERIRRRQDNAKAEANLRWLREETGAHIHADLIAGLPGESLESFASGFDRLTALRPQEIQLGILKRLRGTPIARHDREWSMVYSPDPPYEILQNRDLDFLALQSLKRFARVWDLTANSGNFVQATQLLLHQGGSPFHSFKEWTCWLYAQTHRTDAIALTRLLELVWRYLVEIKSENPAHVARLLLEDYRAGGRSDVPKVLRPHVDAERTAPLPGRKRSRRRQARHSRLS